MKSVMKNIMEKLTKLFVAAIVLAIVGSFVALVIVHILAINKGVYTKSTAYQETIFIALLTLGLMIVLIIPYIINKEQVKREVDNYLTKDYQKNMDQFISKSERDYAHISRMIAYILKHKSNFYWAMAWAGDSVVAYIKRFKELHDDFQLHEEYFIFSLKIMKISFYERGNGTFLEDNIDLEEYESKSDDNSRCIFMFNEYNLKLDETLMNEIRDKINKGNELTSEEKNAIKDAFKDFMNEVIRKKIYEGKELTPKEDEISAVKELKRVILRYIKWQCIIYIEMQEDRELSNNVMHLMKKYFDPDIKKNLYKKLSNNVIRSMKRYLDSDFKKDFKDMVNKTLKSFYHDEKGQFINDIVEKAEPEEQERVNEYLENMFKKEPVSKSV